MSFSVKIEHRFMGPVNMGSGGYVSGLVAGHIYGAAEITLWSPVPLKKLGN